MKCLPKGQGPLHCSDTATTPSVSKMTPRFHSKLNKFKQGLQERCSGSGVGVRGTVSLSNIDDRVEKHTKQTNECYSRLIENRMKRISRRKHVSNSFFKLRLFRIVYTHTYVLLA